MPARRRRTQAALVASMLLVVLAVSGCASREKGLPLEGTSTGAAPVKIGLAVPLTGDEAVYGLGMKRAVELALKEANDSGDVRDAGRRFDLFAVDDRGDPKQAVSVANGIVADTDVVGVVGHFDSGCSLPASKVYQDAGVPMISVSSDPLLTAQGYDVVNRIVAKDDAQGAFAADLMRKKLGFARVGVVDDSTPYGKGLVAEFVERFESGGGTVVLRETVHAKDVDFSALTARMKAAKVQAIYYGGAPTEGALISKQAKGLGLKTPLVGGDVLHTPEYIRIAGAANAAGDICTSLGLPLEQQPRGSDFKAAYREEYSQDPEVWDSYAYDCAWALVRAVLEAGPDRAKVADALRSMAFDGVTGEFRFDGDGDTSNKAISAYRVTGTAWRQVIE
ncbi:MAG: branched-chain amino acid ABC transporter substrate-binding protein [Coriobacteriia bacterium]